jgi:hypothetical protein
MHSNTVLLILLSTTTTLQNNVVNADQYLIYNRTGTYLNHYDCGVVAPLPNLPVPALQALMPVGPTSLCLVKDSTITRWTDLNAPLIPAGESWKADCANGVLNVYNNSNCMGAPTTTRSFGCNNGISFNCTELAWDFVDIYTDNTCTNQVKRYTTAYGFCQVTLDDGNLHNYYRKEVKSFRPAQYLELDSYLGPGCSSSQFGYVQELLYTDYGKCTADYLSRGYVVTAGGVGLNPTQAPTPPTTPVPTKDPTTPKPTTAVPTAPNINCKICVVSGDPHIELRTCPGALVGKKETWDCQSYGWTTMAQGTGWKIETNHVAPLDLSQYYTYVSDFKLKDTINGIEYTFSNISVVRKMIHDAGGSLQYAPFKLSIGADNNVLVDHTEFALSVDQTIVHYCVDHCARSFFSTYIAPMAFTLTTNDMTANVGMCQQKCDVSIYKYVVVSITSRRQLKLDFRSHNATLLANGDQQLTFREQSVCLNSGLTGNFLNWCHIDVTVTDILEFAEHHLTASRMSESHDVIAMKYFVDNSPVRPQFGIAGGGSTYAGGLSVIVMFSIIMVVMFM